jgi:hypothetical protein
LSKNELVNAWKKEHAAPTARVVQATRVSVLPGWKLVFDNAEQPLLNFDGLEVREYSPALAATMYRRFR